MSIGSAVFAQHTGVPRQTDRQTTQRATSVAIGSVYMYCVRVMQPNNNNNNNNNNKN